MATIQDIRALELCIYEVVEEYLDDNDGYDHPVLHVYWDNDQMKYRAEITDGLTGGEDDGVYDVKSVIFEGDEDPEPDVDSISKIANSWLFLD